MANGVRYGGPVPGRYGEEEGTGPGAAAASGSSGRSSQPRERSEGTGPGAAAASGSSGRSSLPRERSEDDGLGAGSPKNVRGIPGSGSCQQDDGLSAALSKYLWSTSGIRNCQQDAGPSATSPCGRGRSGSCSSGSSAGSPASGPHWENPFGANGIFARVGEYIPLVNGGLQRLHELRGDEQALTRARDRNPVGPDGFLTQAAEHIPVVNTVVQEAHRAAGEEEAFERARDRNPIGTNGFVTKVVEHIPLFSDGVRALHQYQGDEMAAERARTHSLQKLLSKDGAITRLAELLPVSNLFAAAAHELFGNRDEAIRALDLLDSWAQALRADGLFTKVAELLPGADAVAFAIHVQGGYYAQAIRSITKVAWVNVDIAQVSLHLSCEDFSHIHATDLHAVSLEIIPRQLSLLVGMSDMLTNFLRMDREGHRRSFRTVVNVERLTASGNTMLLTKELLKAIVDEKIARRIEYFTSQVPCHADWLVEVMNRWTPVWRSRRLLTRLLLPRKIAAMPAALKEELQKAAPFITASAGKLPEPEPAKRRRGGRPRLAQAAAASSCLAFTGGCLGLTAKAGAVALAAAAAAGAVGLGRAAARLALSWLDEWNAECWSDVARKPQPAQSDVAGKSQPTQQTQPSEEPSLPSSSSRAPPPTPDRDPAGLVLEATAADVARVAPLVRRFYFDDVLKGGLRRYVLRLVEPLAHACFRSVLQTDGAGAVVPVVFEIETDEWEMELQDYSWNLRLPSMRMALVLHLSFRSGSPKCTRFFLALPDELVSNLAHCLQEQIADWDLRELDPRFADFTQPVRTAFDFRAQFTSERTLRLDALGVRSRLDLPD